MSLPRVTSKLCGLGLCSLVFVVSVATGAWADKTGRLFADLLLINGKVVTMDDAGTVAEAVAIRDKQFVAVGSKKDLEPLVGPATKVIDLGGRLALPGLVDAHAHTSGIPLDYLDLSQAHSIPEVAQAVARKVAQKPAGSWVVGSGVFHLYSGWDDKRLKEGRWLTRWDIDPISPNHPVLLIKEAGHALLLNSYAMKLAGITKDTPDPKGEILKDPKTGEPTGALVESAMNLAYRILPEPTFDERIHAAGRTSRQLLEWGTTTVADASVFDTAFPVFQALYAQTSEPLVSYVLFPRVPESAPREEVLNYVKSWRVTTNFGDDRLKLGALKIFVDGGVTSLSAWFTKPYKNRPGHYGIQQIDKETLFGLVRLADRLGWQLHFHTCGDAAAELALQALEKAQQENPPRERRHSLTHLYVLSSEQIARMRKLGVIAVLQPNFVYGLSEHMEAALDDDQLSHFIPFRTLLAAGIPVALSADGHPQNPMFGIFAAVVRRGENGHLIGEVERVSVMDALRAYTRTSAYALFEETRRGSIEVGKLADLIVLDRDILSIPPEQIKDTRVLLTIKHGRVAVNRLSSSAGGAN